MYGVLKIMRIFSSGIFKTDIFETLVSASQHLPITQLGCRQMLHGATSDRFFLFHS